MAFQRLDDLALSVAMDAWYFGINYRPCPNFNGGLEKDMFTREIGSRTLGLSELSC